MKRFIHIIAAVALTSPFGILAAQEMSNDAQITEAVSPLPETLRAGATVVTYDAKGDPKVLRQGTNDIVCQPNQPKATPGFSVTCYAKSLAPQRDMEAKLRAEGKDQKEIQAAVKAALDSGKLQAPPMGTMSYSKSGKTEAEAHVLWVMRVPNAKAEDLGLPTKAGKGSPWMMASGTPGAHIMMPQTEESLAAAPPRKPAQ